MPNLITIDRAVQNPTLLAMSSVYPNYLDSLISDVSCEIEEELNRSLWLTSYRIYLSGMGFPYNQIVLPNFPVASIDQIGTNATSVITIQNIDTTNNQYARISTQVDSSTGLTSSVTLTWTASAVTSTQVFTASNYPTLSALASAINALGSGWAASAIGIYGPYPVSELRPLQGAQSCRGQASALSIYLENVPFADWNGGFGGSSTWSGYGLGNEPWRLDAEAGIITGRFPAGMSNIRIDYTAGFVEIPPPIQEACVRAVQIKWESIQRNSNSKGEKIGPYSTTFTESIPSALDNADVRRAIAPYKSRANLTAVY